MMLGRTASGGLRPLAGSIDFVANTGKVGATDYGTIAAMPGYAYVGSAFSVLAGGALTAFAVNTLPRTALGYHSYPAYVQSIANPEAFDNASWTKVNVTATADATNAPDGTLTADKIVESLDGVNTTHYVGFGVPAIGDTIGVFAKQAERTLLRADGNNSDAFRVTFNLATGVIDRIVGVTGGFFSNAVMYPAPNGFYYCGLVIGNSWGAQNVRFKPVIDPDSAPYMGDGASGLYLWHGQNLNLNTIPPPLAIGPITTGNTVACQLSVNFPNGVYLATYTFDDGTTQTVATNIAGGVFNVANFGTTLNRSIITKVDLR